MHIAQTFRHIEALASINIQVIRKWEHQMNGGLQGRQKMQSFRCENMILISIDLIVVPQWELQHERAQR